MFGSKLRSWMENHIVRPRKKGNKNKNATSNNLATTNNTQNGHKGTSISIYQQGDSSITGAASSATTNSISSPARRSEVSPIQSHTTSRFGWQSPKHETAMSPKSDHFMYTHSVKAHTLSSSSSLSTNQSNIVPTASSSSNSSSLIAKKTKTLSPNIMLRKSSSKSNQDSNNMMSSQKIQQSSNNSNHHVHTHTIQQQSSHIHSSQNNQSNHHQPLPNATINQNYQSNGHAMQCLTKNATIKQSQYEINMQNNNKNQNLNTTTKKQVISSSQCVQKSQNTGLKEAKFQNGGSIHQQQQQQQHFDENRYGKILPSKRGGVDGFNASIRSYDNLNANIQFQTIRNDSPLPTDEKQSLSSNGNNNINNNNSISNCMGSMNMQKSTNCVGNGPPYHQHLHHSLHHSGQIQSRNVNEVNRNIIRTNRYSSNSMLGPPPSNHPLAHVINSLSSPESAYSTGYSTDGTSPGATYAPPEYYINIRTGTHYFPKAVNTLAIEATRYKFGLNKIEEMSPQEPLPNNHRRTESFDSGQSKVPGFGIPDPMFFKSKTLQCQDNQSIPPQTIVLPNFKGFESPSPRQRCRIRTNPWYSTTETSSSGGSVFLAKKIEVDASSSSSGIKSSSDAGASDKNEKNEKTSESDTTSSSTEVEVPQRTLSPDTIRRKKITSEASVKSEIHVTHSLHQDSDEDATLNEMMGKFDESYVYEKETDILSDSDPTDCPSDLDTGQDAGDECDTDELLDIDFIDTGSVQEIVEKDAYKNSGSCSYVSYQVDRRSSRKRRSRKQNENFSNSKRKKRFMKTRKKSVENKERSSPIRRSRESRSVGGTPVSLRRNQSADNQRVLRTSPLTNRCNSLTLTETFAVRDRYLAIAESEKALLKADLEADVKYKQLINEAATILVSMKTGNSALRETPVASPRRICNPPANKRVEILRNCEADIKRELSKQPKSVESVDLIIPPPPIVDGVLINKRLEMIKYETNSVPNSPKSGRFSPRKTHITNFINQNASPVELPRKHSMSDVCIKSPQTQLNSRAQKSPSNSPSTRRRMRTQSPRLVIDSDSDSDDTQSKKSSTQRRSSNQKSGSDASTTTDNRKLEISDVFSRKAHQKIRDLNDDLNNSNVVVGLKKLSLYDESDYKNRNIIETEKPSLLSFRSIDMGNRTSISSYCPQSEPLKRKIYEGSSSFERLKKNLDLESEIPKKAILEKISNLRKERQAHKRSNPEMNNLLGAIEQKLSNDEDCISSSSMSKKHQLIVDTIESLKRNLEDQSVELRGLNDNTSTSEQL